MASFFAFDAAADTGVVGSDDVPMQPAVPTSIVFVFPVWELVAFVKHWDSIGWRIVCALVVGSADGVHFVAE
jgi:hypothetical protein